MTIRRKHPADLLRPLPLRITPLQYKRLQDARERDGLALQEHVRRALDIYLRLLEDEASQQHAARALADRLAKQHWEDQMEGIE